MPAILSAQTIGRLVKQSLNTLKLVSLCFHSPSAFFQRSLDWNRESGLWILIKNTSNKITTAILFLRLCTKKFPREPEPSLKPADTFSTPSMFYELRHRRLLVWCECVELSTWERGGCDSEENFSRMHKWFSYQNTNVRKDHLCLPRKCRRQRSLSLIAEALTLKVDSGTPDISKQRVHEASTYTKEPLFCIPT